MNYLTYLRIVGLIFCHLYIADSKCHHGFKVCDIEEWAPWSSCSATCGRGEQIRKKYMCCDDTVKPKTLQNCLDHCNLTISWYESNSVEKKYCGFHCIHGKYNHKEHQCKCETEYSGECCEKVSPTTKFVPQTKPTTTRIAPRTKLMTTATSKPTTTATPKMTTATTTTRPTTASSTKLTTTPPTQPITKLTIPTTKMNTLTTSLTTKSTSEITTVRLLNKVTPPKTRLILSTTKSITPRSTAMSNPRNVLKTPTVSITKLLPSNTISKLVILKTVVNPQLKSTSKRPKAHKTSVRKHSFSTSKSVLFSRTTTAKQTQGRLSHKLPSPVSITINRKPTVKFHRGNGETTNSLILNNVYMLTRTKAQQGKNIGTTKQRSDGKTIQESSLRPSKTNVPSILQAQNRRKTTFAKQTNLFMGQQTNINGAFSKNNILTYSSHGGKGNQGTSNISYHSLNGNGNMNMMSSCLGDPCQHGTCLPMSSQYFCFCDPGYEGRNCQINTDECENDPCQYGHCIDKVKDFHCECSVFFQGKKCTKLKTWAIVFITLSALALCLTSCCCFWCISTCTNKDGKIMKVEPVVEPLPEKPRPSPIGKPNAWLD